MKQKVFISVMALSLLATAHAWGQTTVIKRTKTETENRAEAEKQRQRVAERARHEKEEAERREADRIRTEAERKIREEREQFLRDSLAQAEMRALADGDLVILDELEYFYYKDFDKGMWKYHGLRMHFRNDESIEVVGGMYGGHAYSYEVIKIPSYVKRKDSDKRYPVTHIAEKTFGGNLSIIEGVILPNTIIEIGDNAFEGCSRTKSIVIPNSVKKIGKHLFAGKWGCLENLTNVSIPSHLVNQLGEGTFGNYQYSKVKSINVRYPDGTTKDIPVKEEWK